MKIEDLATWELLQKQLTWKQLGDFKGKRILEFGCGNGVMGAHYAADNTVIAIEPDGKVLEENPYPLIEQICGGVEALEAFEEGSFDVILCHNVLEYAAEREEILAAFERLLKVDGLLSVLKHNRLGRVMQMAVLLNDFEQANDLLDGKESHAVKYGTIRYYEDEDLVKWAPKLKITKVLGMRTFWDLQQEQSIQKDQKWQTDMMQLEERVSDKPAFKQIAFFHHVFMTKA